MLTRGAHDDVVEVLLDLALEVAAAVVVEQVPLVEGEHERAARLEHEVDDAQVLRRDLLGDVDARRRRPRPSRARPRCGATRRSRHPAAGGRACGCRRCRRSVQMRPAISTCSSTGSRVVPASSLTTTRSSPAALFSSERLADVRAAEDRDAAGAADLLLRDGRDRGQLRHDHVEQVGDAAAVQRRDGERLAEAERSRARRPRGPCGRRRSCWRRG